MIEFNGSTVPDTVTIKHNGTTYEFTITKMEENKVQVGCNYIFKTKEEAETIAREVGPVLLKRLGELGLAFESSKDVIMPIPNEVN